MRRPAAAIADVLGDAVTPQVAAGWEEVYWLMTELLTSQERGLYSARGVRPETVWRDWEVVEKVPEPEDVVTFTDSTTEPAPDAEHLSCGRTRSPGSSPS